jgi:hypothetical protein
MYSYCFFRLEIYFGPSLPKIHHYNSSPSSLKNGFVVVKLPHMAYCLHLRCLSPYLLSCSAVLLQFIVSRLPRNACTSAAGGLRQICDHTGSDD